MPLTALSQNEGRTCEISVITRQMLHRRKKRMLRMVLAVIGIAMVASIGACSLKSHSRNAAFDAVQEGDTEAAVIARFDTLPSVRESPGTLFARYASQPCDGECAERLWFENRWSFDTEAWSVELDSKQRVIRKSRWASP